MGSNYEKLNARLFGFEVPEDILKMYEDASVVGSLICTECDELTQGVSVVFNMLSITVYSSCMEILSVIFDQMTQESDYDASQIPAIQSSISALANSLDEFSL